MVDIGLGPKMRHRDVLALDWSIRLRIVQPLRCCKPRPLGANEPTQSPKPLSWAVMGMTTIVVVISSQYLRFNISQLCKFILKH